MTNLFVIVSPIHGRTATVTVRRQTMKPFVEGKKIVAYRLQTSPGVAPPGMADVWHGILLESLVILLLEVD